MKTNLTSFVACFVVCLLLVGCSAANTSTGETNASKGRPSRPQEAAMGHWADEGADLYVSKGEQGLDCTWVYRDGRIEEHQMVVKGENAKSGVLTLVRWYRKDQRGGGKDAGVGTFSDGREMKEEWRFNADKTAFTVWGLHFRDGMTERQTMRYVDGASKP